MNAVLTQLASVLFTLLLFGVLVAVIAQWRADRREREQREKEQLELLRQLARQARDEFDCHLARATKRTD